MAESVFCAQTKSHIKSILLTVALPKEKAFLPCRESAYTVWNQKTGARTSNYGSRVDFILAAGPDKADPHSPAAGHGADQNSPAAVPGADADSPAAGDEAAASRPAASAGMHTETQQGHQVSLDSVMFPVWHSFLACRYLCRRPTMALCM